MDNIIATTARITFLLSGYALCFILVFVAVRFIVRMDRATCKQDNENVHEGIAEFSDGKKYCNILEITTAQGEHIKLKGYSNAQHTVNTFADSCDRVMRSDDGITVYSEKDCSFFPMDKVKQVIVKNEKI